MLEAIRRYAYSWTTRVFLLLLAGVFAIFFGSLGSYFSSVRPVATVNCRTFLMVPLGGCHQILADDVDLETRSIRNTLTNAYGQNAAAVMKNMNLRETAVIQLIQQALIVDEAHRLGLSIGDDQLARQIESQTAFQSDGHFDQQLYRRVLAQNDFEPALFESKTRDQMLADELRDTVSNTVQVNREEARHAFDLVATQMNLAYIEVPYTNYTAGISPTDQEVAKFYNDNKEAFREPERIRVAFIRYDPSALSGSYVATDPEIQDFYDQNVKTMFSHPAQVRARHILISLPADASAADKAAAKAKAEDILSKLRSGANFAALARQYSNDPGTRDRGGELPFFGRGELVKPFEDLAFSLKPGEYGIALSQFGYHIIQVEESKPAHVDTPEEGRPRIVEALKRKAGQDEGKQDAQQDLTAALTGHGLDEIARKRGLSAVETAFFAANEPVQGADDYPQLAQAAFKLSDGETQDLSDGPEPYLVKLLARTPAHIPALADIKDLVRKSLIRMTAEHKAHEQAEAMLKQIKSPEDFGAVAAQNHLAAKNTGDFPRFSRELPQLGPFEGVTGAAAAVPTLPAVIGKVMANGGNSYLFEVVSRTSPGDEQWNLQSRAFTDRLLEQRRGSAWVNYVNELKGRADIEIHPELLGSTSG